MSPFPREFFRKQDESNDDLFYVMPRKVVHIDDGAIAALSVQFAQLLPPGGVYLDLMSSWRSHLPNSLQPKRVVGLGMNADDLTAMKDKSVNGWVQGGQCAPVYPQSGRPS